MTKIFAKKISYYKLCYKAETYSILLRVPQQIRPLALALQQLLP